MAQVMVNFRMDEDVKKNMEQACREMGMSMTTAFTIFATKVGREKRIPFEITAEPQSSRRRRGSAELPPAREEEQGPAQRQERLERLCAEIRRALTSIHIAIPASITGLAMERIRLLCGDELKDKAAKVSSACKGLFSAKNAGSLKERDLGILDEYADSLASIEGELLALERTLIPAMKAYPEGSADGFTAYEQRLAGVSRRFDELAPVMQRFWSSIAPNSGSQGVRERIRRAAAPVETAYVLTALENLEALVLRHWDILEGRTAARLESDYLQTLELTLQELARAERSGGEVGERAALCLRVVNVLSQVLSDGGRARQEWDRRSLEAEVEALERLTAMRGETGGVIRLEG